MKADYFIERMEKNIKYLSQSIKSNYLFIMGYLAYIILNIFITLLGFMDIISDSFIGFGIGSIVVSIFLIGKISTEIENEKNILRREKEFLMEVLENIEKSEINNA